MTFYEGSLGEVSNCATWEQEVEVVYVNGDPVTITGASIDLDVERQNSTSPQLSAEVGDGITIATPRFTFTFTETQMNTLCPGAYKVGCRIQLNGQTNWTQLIIGTVIVADGIVE